MDNNRRSQLDAVLHSYYLTGVVEFPTRFGLNSQTAIDSVLLTYPPLEITNYTPL